MGIHMRNGINYTWGNDGIAREIETIWDTGFTPSPGVWLTYDFGVDFEDYDELIFVIGRGGEANPITEFTMHPKKIGINSLNDVDSGLAFKFDVWGGNQGWIAHNSGTTYSLGADYGGSPPKYIAIYGVKYINSSNNEYSYSTTEHKIGTWIDGKDVFEKTYTFNSLPSVGDWTSFDSTLSIDTFVDYNVMFTRSNGQIDNSPDTLRVAYNPPNARGNLCYYPGGVDATHIIVRYTKTTS